MDSKRYYFILGTMSGDENKKCLIKAESIDMIIQENAENIKTRLVLNSGREINLKDDSKDILDQLKEITWNAKYYFNI